MPKCISFYDVMDFVGNNNPLLTSTKDRSMGGPLSQPLNCGDEQIKTYYSERILEKEDEDFKDLHYVEMYSNDKQSDTEYALYRFFTHLDDLEKI